MIEHTEAELANHRANFSVIEAMTRGLYDAAHLSNVDPNTADRIAGHLLHMIVYIVPALSTTELYRLPDEIKQNLNTLYPALSGMEQTDLDSAAAVFKDSAWVAGFAARYEAYETYVPTSPYQQGTFLVSSGDRLSCDGVSIAGGFYHGDMTPVTFDADGNEVEWGSYGEMSDVIGAWPGTDNVFDINDANR